MAESTSSAPRRDFAEAGRDTAVATPQAPTPTPSPPPPPPSLLIDDIAFQAELAVTLGERAKGLSDRDELQRMTGMLFIYATPTIPRFWMNGMRFSLDFIWVSEDCVVSEITPNVPVPEPDQEDLPSYTPSSPVLYNFEINAGEAQRHGIGVGARVRFLGFPDSVARICD